MGICPPSNLKPTWWSVQISQDISELLSNEGYSNVSDSNPLFYKSKHFLTNQSHCSKNLACVFPSLCVLQSADTHAKAESTL